MLDTSTRPLKKLARRVGSDGGGELDAGTRAAQSGPKTLSGRPANSGAMADCSERVDQLLFDGETVESNVDVGGGTVVVTSHRLLVFTPEGEGPRYRAIDRPNVLGVEQRAISPYEFRSVVAKLGVGAVLFLLLGLFVDPRAVIPTPDLSSAQGAGGLLGPVETMLDAFYALDEVALVLGALLALAGSGLLGVQLATRTDRLAIEIAGDEDVLLSFGVEDATLATLQSAIEGPPGEAPPRPEP
jgi:hypothetical protein